MAKKYGKQYGGFGDANMRIAGKMPASEIRGATRRLNAKRASKTSLAGFFD